jgi:subtilase family serine protease
MLIDFSGPAYAIRQAFHTSIHQLDVSGEQHLSNIGDPQIPAALAPVVKGIASLNDFRPHPMYKPVTEYTFAGCASSASLPTEPGTCYAVTPEDNQVIYNLNPLYNSGHSGQGQTIYLVEDTDTYGASGTNGKGDWNTYRSTFGLATNFPLGTYTMAHPGGCTDPGTNGDDGEAAIDVDVASAIAPSAGIQLISCPSSTFTFGGQIALQNLINQSSPTLGVVSVSYGECEALNGAGNNALFNSTYQQAAAEGFSVFVSSGDEGPSSCSNEFSVGSEYDVTSLGVTGWGETPYNVTVGGTDFEDTYNSKTGGSPLSTYWSATNDGNFGSALSYIPEIPWNDACGSALISEVATGSFFPYGASPATCNNSLFDTTSSYLSTGAASGGASNCATGAAGTNQSSFLITQPGCQGYAKPSYQSGASLNGGQAVFGQPSDGVRDIPDVSMFAANGVWGH